MIIPVNESSYIVADVSTTEDPQGLRDKNFKGQQGISVGYANKVQANEMTLALALAKFDLTPLKGRRIRSATVQMYALQGNLASAPRLVDLSVVTGAWSENDATYAKRPDWVAKPLATEGIYAANRWHSWDVSGSLVRSDTLPATISYALGLRTLQDKTAEQVVFAAKASSLNVPASW